MCICILHSVRFQTKLKFVCWFCPSGRTIADCSGPRLGLGWVGEEEEEEDEDEEYGGGSKGVEGKAGLLDGDDGARASCFVSVFPVPSSLPTSRSN